MKLPKSVKIGGRRFKVAAYPPTEADLAKARGLIQYDPGQILVDMRPEQGMQAETLVHEILHGCIEDSGISLPEKKEERLIRALSPRLAAFMADNKDVVREILKAL